MIDPNSTELLVNQRLFHQWTPETCSLPREHYKEQENALVWVMARYLKQLLEDFPLDEREAIAKELHKGFPYQQWAQPIAERVLLFSGYIEPRALGCEGQVPDLTKDAAWHVLLWVRECKKWVAEKRGGNNAR